MPLGHLKLASGVAHLNRGATMSYRENGVLPPPSGATTTLGTGVCRL